MFMLPAPPSPEAETHELADFAELLCWEKGQTSAREIVAYLGQVDENDNNEGCDDDEDENLDLLDDTMNEIDSRAKACGEGYPFILERAGTTIRFAEHLTPRRHIYLYLLLSTRLNMRDNRNHDGLDGAHLLEELSAHVLKNYLGKGRAHSRVFGTSIGGTFQERIGNLCKELCEGVSFRSLDGASVTAKDDKLDAVAWIPFADSLPGQLIVFGQCKTGTNWGDLASQLQPEAFIKKWLQEPIVVNPIRAFCIAEAADRSRWKGTGVLTGILFDRCRMVDYADGPDQRLLEKITRWTSAAHKSIAVPQATRHNKKASKAK